MAGMAIIFTIFIYGAGALLAALIVSLILRFLAKRKFPEENASSDFIATVARVPFLALLWVVVALLLHVLISNFVAHQDCGFSPDPYVTLPNGYVLGSHNTYDGYIRAPGFETGVPMAGPGYVRSIIDLEFANGIFTGTQFDFKSGKVRPFTFDTRTRTFQTPDDERLAGGAPTGSQTDQVNKWAAAETSAHEDSNSYWNMYGRYRHHWPNYVLLLLIVGGEAVIALRLGKTWARATHLRG